MIETAVRLRKALDDSSYDWLVLGSAENIGYSTGYRSVAGDLFRSHRMLALVSVDRTVLVGGASDGAAAFDAGISPQDYVAFGTFFFESTDPMAPELALAAQNDSFHDAVLQAVSEAGVTGRVGVDAEAADLVAVFASEATDVADVVSWMHDRRSVKLNSEIEKLRISARLAEQGITAAIDAAAVGISETELARIVATAMAVGGGFPRFIVVTSGPRSALSDARATDRAIRAGDLLRFDVGCTFDGYWSDVGRTAVVGEPSPLQTSRYEAILAGEQAQLAMMRPGVSAERVFDVAIAAVEDAGLTPYRRHHCGHAIGTEVYERPVISPGSSTILEAGMVFCIETPYYEVGWGGMMIEDTVVVTDSGVDMLTASDRSMRVIDS